MGRGDAQVLLRLVRGQPRNGSHAQRLQAFYGPQAEHYDAFRERLLHGRDELMDLLAPEPGTEAVELGAGTGRNLGFLGERLAGLRNIDLVDLCPALLEQARRRTLGLPNVRVVEADAATYRPAGQVELVYFSYSLTMIPDWGGALRNALSMLKPGGRLGVVDFYVSEAYPPPGLARHNAFSRWFWPRWFGHDGVHPNPAHLTSLRQLLPDHELREVLAPVPYLPGVQVPYFIFVGRVPARGANGALSTDRGESAAPTVKREPGGGTS
jgi:S-adenosylmethionine-diacylgycerolhomoserine-N-methlytransferase